MRKAIRLIKSKKGMSQILVTLVLLVLLTFVMSQFLFGTADDGAIDSTQKTATTVMKVVNDLNGTMPSN